MRGKQTVSKRIGREKKEKGLSSGSPSTWKRPFPYDFLSFWMISTSFPCRLRAPAILREACLASKGEKGNDKSKDSATSKKNSVSNLEDDEDHDGGKYSRRRWDCHHSIQRRN
jgi:hypothetical protein